MASKKELTNGKYVDDQMGNGIPEGGRVGQVLKKISDADYDVDWGTVLGGGGIGGNQNLQQVTDIGNSTTNSVIIGTNTDDGSGAKLQVTGNVRAQNTISSGTGFGFSIIQDQSNSSDLGDTCLSLGHKIEVNSTHDELVIRTFALGTENNLTGGGTVQNHRVFNIASFTYTDSVTTNLDQIFIERGSTYGTVINNRGVYISNLQGNYQASFVANNLSATNRTLALLGTATIPAGAWSIYSSTADSSYFNGPLLIGTTTNNGTDKLQVSGSILATSIKKSGGLSSQYLMADGSTSTGPSLTGYVPTSRTLTINGTGYDLTANRSWSVGTVTGVTATSPITSSGGTAPVISTSMATNKLIGRSSAGTGVMEEITVGTGLSLSGGTINATVQSVGFEQNFLLMGA
jgi:hypothetical protein